MNNDLISRAALRNEFDTKCHGECCICIERDNESGECGLVRWAPVVDAEPVRHGRWRKINVPKRWNGPIIRCSECNTGGTRAWDYCPNCGAKMDGGAQNVNANG